MNRRTISLFLLLVLVCVKGLAQQRKVIGRIVEHGTDKPMRDVNVIIHGTPKGTFTNVMGYFELTIDPVATTLVASHVGYETSMVEVPQEDRFKFSMQKEVALLRTLNLADFPRPAPPTAVARPNASETNDYVIVESGAEYPEGMQTFYTILGNALCGALPDISTPGITIEFTINPDGVPADFQLSDSSNNRRKIIADVFSSMPKWIPAKQRGRNVPQYFTIDIFRGPKLDLKAFYVFMTNNLRYLPEMRRKGIEGISYVQFEISNSGVIIHAKCVMCLGTGADDEVIRALSLVPQDAVKGLAATNYSKFLLPVTFGLDNAHPLVSFPHGEDVLGLSVIELVAAGIRR